MKEQVGSIDPFISPADGDMELENGSIWIGDENNIAAASSKITTDNLPDLNQNYIWVGDENNRPILKSYNDGGGGNLPSGGEANQLLQISSDGSAAEWGGYFDTTNSGIALSPDGSVNVSARSIAIGNLIEASGASSIALGDESSATGQGSIAVGLMSSSTGVGSTALGYGSHAYTDCSTALGYNAVASGIHSTALGKQASAQGAYSVALGDSASVNGDYSTALGNSASATGVSSIALGSYASAIGNYSIALGHSASAVGNYSIILGSDCNVGIGTSSPQYGIHLGAESSNFKPQIYLTGLSNLPTTKPSTSSDAVLYANKGNLYYGNSTSASNQVASTSYVNNAISASNPIGTIIMWAGSTAPENYWECDGKQKSKATYGDLFNAIGYTWGGSGDNFRLPDTRGYFPRGYSNATTIDPDKGSRTAKYSGGNTGDNVGTYQNSAIPSHTHVQEGYYNCSGDGKQVRARNLISSDPKENGADVTGPAGIANLPSNVTATSESRPINFSIMFCIKYK